MRVFAYLDFGPNGEFDANLLVPYMDKMVEGQREQTRDRVTAFFMALYKSFPTELAVKIKVRFEDECEKCYTVKAGPGDHHCLNQDCENGFPNRADLSDLMRRMPYHKHEMAGDYLARLTDVWRKEHSVKPDVKKKP